MGQTLTLTLSQAYSVGQTVAYGDVLTLASMKHRPCVWLHVSQVVPTLLPTKLLPTHT